MIVEEKHLKRQKGRSRAMNKDTVRYEPDINPVVNPESYVDRFKRERAEKKASQAKPKPDKAEKKDK